MGNAVARPFPRTVAETNQVPVRYGTDVPLQHFIISRLVIGNTKSIAYVAHEPEAPGADGRIPVKVVFVFCRAVGMWFQARGTTISVFYISSIIH